MTKTDTLEHPMPIADVAAVIDTAPPATGSLYRLYLLDADTDPETPQTSIVYKRSDVGYTELQKSVRNLLDGSKPEEEVGAVYTDAELTSKFVFEDGHNWQLAITRKQGARGATKPGIDKAWVKAVLSDESKSDAEKLAALARFV